MFMGRDFRINPWVYYTAKMPPNTTLRGGYTAKMPPNHPSEIRRDFAV
jgi:hypothetical protein